MRQHLISHICFCYLNCVSVIFCFVLQIAGGGCFWSKIIGGRFNVSCFRLHKYQGTISWPRTFIFLIDGSISGIMAFTFYRLSDWLDKITSFTHFHLSFYLFIIYYFFGKDFYFGSFKGMSGLVLGQNWFCQRLFKENFKSAQQSICRKIETEQINLNRCKSKWTTKNQPSVLLFILQNVELSQSSILL